MPKPKSASLVFPLAKAEARNLTATKKMFGRANELVGLVEALYQNLPRCFNPAARTELEKRVVKTQMQMLAFCCRQLIIGTLALMRGYRASAC